MTADATSRRASHGATEEHNPSQPSTALRRASCARCAHLFHVCRQHDRGQIYCSPRCRREGVAGARRRANRRHQASPEGRSDHRDRQRRYRERQRAQRRAAQSVTDMGSRQTESADIVVPSTAPAPPILAAATVSAPSKAVGRLKCAECHRTSHWVYYYHAAMLRCDRQRKRRKRRGSGHFSTGLPGH